ncbi:uncharacterized protein LOC110447832 [Mizuhopecten yessoensis]|uniref:uncharacterized protein LOC110447832 n=1 Tax=Mizuhopecten yessoensis TaxID=6573 RepID=UPI000B45AD65|nr:uncharacterized protein LOC110447832 [Mizuhopecten yessoensis]
MAVSASWYSIGQTVLWYEWSVGYTHSDIPDGVYDHLNDRVWHDASQFHNVTVTFPRGKELKSGFQYSVFIRSWFSITTYAVYKSDGVTIVDQPPSVTKLLGAMVKERQHGTNKKEVDFTNDPMKLYIDWSGVFLGAEEHIHIYDIYVSLFPGGHGIFESSVSLPAHLTSHNITWAPFRSQVKYYTNVIGYGHSGIYRTAVSDGFVFDTDQPISGLVSDGLGIHDTDYQNASEQLGATWAGFRDTTGLIGYYWCVGVTADLSDCSVLPWRFVGLHTAYFSNITTPVIQGSKLFNKVYAVDIVGQHSVIAVSDGVVIDYTPPIPSKYISWRKNIVDNPSFESSLQNSNNLSTALESDLCSILSVYRPVDWKLEGCGGVVRETKNNVNNNFLLVQMSVSQTLENLEIGEEYRVSFVTKHMTLPSSVMSNAEAYVKFGSETRMFFLHKKYGRNEPGHRENFQWETHLYYFQASSVSETLTLGSIGPSMGFAIDDIVVQQFDSVADYDSDGMGHIETKLHFIHEQTIVRAKWTFEDMESPIIDYTWSIGTVRGGLTLQSLTSVGRNTFSSNSNLNLDHNAIVHVTVMATNAAGLRTILHADPILVDLTPPVVLRINDGSGEDLSMQSSNIITVNWKIIDPESGIQSCAWAIGTNYFENDIQSFTKVPATATSAFVELNMSRIDGKKVYSSVECENGASLKTLATTNGVQITTTAPVLPYGTIDVIEMSATEYPAQDGYQSSKDKFETVTSTKNTLSVDWSDVFSDTVDIHFYEVSAGTLGGVDIVQWQYTTENHLVLGIPDKIVDQETVLIHIVVKAVERSGLYTTCKTTLHF